jgi:hypothetical protein
MMLAYSDQIMRVLFPDAIFRPTPYSNGEIDPVQPDLASRSLPPACGLGIGELFEAKILYIFTNPTRAMQNSRGFCN